MFRLILALFIASTTSSAFASETFTRSDMTKMCKQAIAEIKRMEPDIKSFTMKMCLESDFYSSEIYPTDDFQMSLNNSGPTELEETEQWITCDFRKTTATQEIEIIYCSIEG